MVKSNSADAFKIHVNMMRMTGVWPEHSPGLLSNMKAAITWGLTTLLSVIMTLEVINDITDVGKLSEILYIMVTVTIFLVKLLGFAFERKTFMYVVDYLKDPVFLSYPDEFDHYMVKTIKSSTLLANIYRYMCLCCMFMFALTPILDDQPLPFPFPYELGRYRYLMFTVQMAGISCVAWNNSCLDTLTTSLMGIGAAQLDILIEKLVCILNEESGNKEGTIEKLQQCVEHHLAIIKFIESVNRVFTVGLLAQFMASILIICNTLFHFVLVPAASSHFFMLTNYFAIMITQVTIYCWYGNEIMWKSTQVGEACYLSQWYTNDKEVAQYLFIIMERSKRPLTITAWKFSKLSLTALTSILQWSYSYLALLLKMYRKEATTSAP